MAVVPTRRTTFAAVAVLSLGVATVAAAGSASAQTGGHRHTVSKASTWAAHADRSAAVPSKDAVSAKVWLAPRNGAALTALASAVSDPSSAQYGRYLSEGAYRAQFAPTAAQVSAVESWLKGAGLHVQGVGSDNHFVSVSGSATAINSAFAAGVRQFTVNGQTVLGSTSDVTVPDALAGDVLAVTGLDTLGHQVRPGARTGLAAKDTPSDKVSPADDGDPLGPPPGFVNSNTCSSSYGTLLDRQDPKFQGDKLPLLDLWVHRRPVPRRLRRQQERAHRQGCHRRHHRRLRGADDPPGREHLVPQAGRQEVPARPVHPEQRHGIRPAEGLGLWR